MLIEKCSTLTSFLNQVHYIATAENALWHGKSINESPPINTANLMTFFLNNQEWLLNCRAPELNTDLKQLREKVKHELTDQEGTNDLIKLLSQTILEMDTPSPVLPMDIWMVILRMAGLRMPDSQDEEAGKTAVRETLSQTAIFSLVSRLWKGMSDEIRAQLINELQFSLDDLGFKDKSKALAFIISSGKFLHYLDSSLTFNQEEWKKIVTNCPNLKKVHIKSPEVSDGTLSHLHELPHLTHLALAYTPQVTRLPQLTPGLVSLNLMGWPQNKLPDLSQFDALKELTLGFTTSPIDLNSVKWPPHLTSLQLIEMDIQDIPKIPVLANLLRLGVFNCGITALSLLTGKTKITELLLVDCRKLKSFPETMHLSPIQSFTLDGSIVEALPSLAHFSQLVQLKINDFEKLEKLPHLSPSLTNLHIEKCPKIETLGNCLNGLTLLTDLEVIKCKKLKEFPTLIDQNQLRNLIIADCKSLPKPPLLPTGLRPVVYQFNGTSVLKSPSSL